MEEDSRPCPLLRSLSRSTRIAKSPNRCTSLRGNPRTQFARVTLSLGWSLGMAYCLSHRKQNFF